MPKLHQNTLVQQNSVAVWWLVLRLGEQLGCGCLLVARMEDGLDWHHAHTGFWEITIRGWGLALACLCEPLWSCCSGFPNTLLSPQDQVILEQRGSSITPERPIYRDVRRKGIVLLISMESIYHNVFC